MLKPVIVSAARSPIGCGQGVNGRHGESAGQTEVGVFRHTTVASLAYEIWHLTWRCPVRCGAPNVRDDRCGFGAGTLAGQAIRCGRF